MADAFRPHGAGPACLRRFETVERRRMEGRAEEVTARRPPSLKLRRAGSLYRRGMGAAWTGKAGAARNSLLQYPTERRVGARGLHDLRGNHGPCRTGALTGRVVQQAVKGLSALPGERSGKNERVADGRFRRRDADGGGRDDRAPKPVAHDWDNLCMLIKPPFRWMKPLTLTLSPLRGARELANRSGLG